MAAVPSLPFFFLSLVPYPPPLFVSFLNADVISSPNSCDYFLFSHQFKTHTFKFISCLSGGSSRSGPYAPSKPIGFLCFNPLVFGLGGGRTISLFLVKLDFRVSCVLVYGSEMFLGEPSPFWVMGWFYHGPTFAVLWWPLYIGSKQLVRVDFSFVWCDFITFVQHFCNLCRLILLGIGGGSLSAWHFNSLESVKGSLGCLPFIRGKPCLVFYCLILGCDSMIFLDEFRLCSFGFVFVLVLPFHLHPFHPLVWCIYHPCWWCNLLSTDASLIGGLPALRLFRRFVDCLVFDSLINRCFSLDDRNKFWESYNVRDIGALLLGFSVLSFLLYCFSLLFSRLYCFSIVSGWLVNLCNFLL